MTDLGTCSICGLPRPCQADWRAKATRLAVQVEDLEHEVGALKEKLRRIVGYVNSVGI